VDDVYKIPTTKTEGFYKEKGSKFHSYLYPVQTEDDVQSALEEIGIEHHKARHICYAYRLSPKSNVFRMNDDGEPSGTAGKPIFGQIRSAELHEVFIAVVRYFGGTKLGASGLIRAYKTAAEETTSLTKVKKKFDTVSCKISFKYAVMGEIMNHVKSLNLAIIEQSFDVNPYIVVELRKAISDLQINQIKGAILNRPVDDIQEDTEVEDVQFEILNLKD